MTKISKITITDELKIKIDKSLADQPVLFAYLFGSALTDHTHHASDIDIALYLDPKLSAGDRFEAQIPAIGVLAEAFAVDSDLINTTRLNDVPHLLQYTAITEGQVIYERDHGSRLDFELRVLQEEDDQQSFRRAYNTDYFKKLAAGSI